MWYSPQTEGAGMASSFPSTRSYGAKMTKIEQIIQDLAFVTVDDFTNSATIRTHTLAGTTKDACKDTAGNYWLKDFCWPVAAVGELREVCNQREILKKALDDSMSLVYQLSNKYSDGGPK